MTRIPIRIEYRQTGMHDMLRKQQAIFANRFNTKKKHIKVYTSKKSFLVFRFSYNMFCIHWSLIFTSSHTTFVNNVCMHMLSIWREKIIINKIILKKKKQVVIITTLLWQAIIHILTTINCCNTQFSSNPIQNAIMDENFLIAKKKK